MSNQCLWVAFLLDADLLAFAYFLCCVGVKLIERFMARRTFNISCQPRRAGGVICRAIRYALLLRWRMWYFFCYIVEIMSMWGTWQISA